MSRRASVLAVFLGALAACALIAVAARAGLPTFEQYERGAGAFANSKSPESCTSCHFAQPAAPVAVTPAADVERRDIVIVGGGMAGLTAAWRLRDRDVLVLEKEARGGGKMVRAEWEGILHSAGPAYLLEPEGDVKALLGDLGLAPRRIPEPANALAVGPGKVVPDPWGAGVKDLPFDEGARARLAEAFAALRPRREEVRVPAWSSSEAMRELDQRTADDFFAEVGPEIRKVVEPYIKSCFSAPMDEISALAALAFFCFEFDPIWSFPGGLGAIPERLEERLGERVRHGCFVTEVEPKEGGGVRVAYLDRAGAVRRVEARAAIVAVSQTVARHIVKGLDEERMELMGSIYHGAYAVLAVKTSRPVWDGVYDTWFSEGPVTDVIVADWVARGGAPHATTPTASILSAYMPLLVTGRSELLTTTVDELKARALGQLKTFLPALGEPGVLRGVDLFLHGHGMHVPYPRYLTEVAPKLAEPVGDIHFAGVELDLPCIESAVWSGVRAAKAVEAGLAKRRE